MQDPAHAVPVPLLQHVHLVSTMQFPHQQQAMPNEVALHHLKNAPAIVRQMRPMRWEYWQAPSDGKVILCWQPQSLLGNNFATDGYVWAEPEAQYTVNVQGWTMEIFVREAGFIPAREPVAVHRRLRYRLVASPTGAPVETELEIVHYAQNAPEHRMRSNAMPLDPNLSNLLQQRAHLDQNGPIERKEFMLHDQASWPRLNFPGQSRPMPGNPYQNNVMAGRPGMPGMPGQAGPAGPFPFGQGQGMRPGGMVGPSPVKGRPQTAVPGMPMPPRVRDENPILADEELAVAGDFMDLLTPRDLSAIRYKQHHEWMEEILASPYATKQITPISLRMQLSGDLSSITQGILDGKEGEETERITEEQVKELERRVEAYQRTGEAQLADMRRQHEERMAKLSQQKLFANLERQLAQAPKDSSAASQATVERLVGEAEAATGGKLRSRQEVIEVQKGGLLERGKENVGMTSNREHNPSNGANSNHQSGDESAGNGGNGGITEGMNGPSLDGQNGQDNNDDFADFANLDTAGEALQDFYTESTFDNIEFGS